MNQSLVATLDLLLCLKFTDRLATIAHYTFEQFMIRIQRSIWLATIESLQKLGVNVDIEQQIRDLATEYANQLYNKIEDRVKEMEEDDDYSHFLIYRVLGVTTNEGKLIDIYQNKGRFLYKYAGSFLEEATKLCFKNKFPDSGSVRIDNTIGQRPKTFEIDCLVDQEAIEIKWRDATTDGDHITKEHTRMQNIQQAGYKPIRVMFYYPQRQQAKKIQEALETLYKGVGGEYYWGEAAWSYIKLKTDTDLKIILEKIAQDNAYKDEL